MDTFLSVQAETLDRLLQQVADETNPWPPEDYPALLEHQWHAPLLADLPTLADVDADAVREMSWDPDGLKIESFGQLLSAAAPPAGLLIASKKYFKPCAAGTADHMPRDVAAVLYYAVVGVARATHVHGVSTLQPSRLAEGLDWSLNQKWLSEACREVLQRARDAIDPKSF